MFFYKKENAFSIIELMITMAIIGVVSAVSIPGFKQWSRNYNLQSAAIDLYSHMQMAKLGAVKENRLWNINFNPGGILGYEVRSSAQPPPAKPAKIVKFGEKYAGEILFADPTASKTYDAPTLSFNASGLSDKGYAYISNKSRSKYYRVGLPFSTGSIRIEKWNGIKWE